MATSIVTTSTCATTARIATSMVGAMPTSDSPALAKNSCFELTMAEQCSSGADSLTTASTNALATASPESTAPSSETRVSTYQAPSFAKRMQLLMRRGLIAGITPTSTAKRSPQRILVFASSQLDGNAAATRKEDYLSSKESRHDAAPAAQSQGDSNA